MKKLILLSFALSVATVPVSAGVVFSEGFDDITTLAGAGWTVVDLSSPVGTQQWFQGNSGIFPSHSGAANSYVAANFLASSAGGSVDLYLLAPLMPLYNGDVISLYTRTEGAFFADRLQIGVWNLGPLAALNGAGTPGAYPTDWTVFSATITGWVNGTPGQFGVRYYGPADDLNYIGIDSLTLTRIPEPSSLLLALPVLAMFARRRRG